MHTAVEEIFFAIDVRWDQKRRIVLQRRRIRGLI